MAGLGAMSVVYLPFVFALVLVLGVYAAASLGFSVSLARRHGWRYLWGLPVVFGTIHVSWGLGFWWGMGRFLLRGGREG